MLIPQLTFFYSIAGTGSADELFVINPTNHTVEEGDTISFRCGVLPSAPVPQQWAYKLFNSTTDLPITLDPDASTGLTPE